MIEFDSEITQRLVLGDNARWPLARLRGIDPAVVDEHMCGVRHALDLGYVGLERDLFVPVMAAQSGEVTAALCTTRGYEITIDHGGWSTRYGHLTRMFVAPHVPLQRWQRQSVRAGEIIGYAATSEPHLCFEVWRRTATGELPEDPIAHLRTWSVTADAGAY